MIQRVRAKGAGKTSKGVAIDVTALEGADLGVNIYYNGELLDPRLILNSYVDAATRGDITTAQVYEQGNLYFTAARALAAIGTALHNSANILLTYNPGASSISADLTETGVTPGVYGDAGHVPQITVDAYGRITNVTLVPIGLRTDIVLVTESGDYITTESGDHIAGYIYG